MMGQKIMVVDDDPTMLKLAETTLRMRGFEVVTANNGQKAIEVAQRERPALIVMDLRMPEMDGKTAMHILKQAPETRDIPILVISGLPPEQALAGPGEAVGFLEKPFALADLAKEIRIAISRHPATR